ncbi:MAG: DUF1816 domain-containing protein [Gemmatimonadaceae bacterium]|nr:DUF1816 domain-containing protein [Gloeobacterales cyanobacterium ES-bin-141]
MHIQINNTLNTCYGNWWLEVTTDEPFLYEFGPFQSAEEAAGALSNYVSDLASEGWRVIRQKVLQQEHLFSDVVSRAR